MSVFVVYLVKSFPANLARVRLFPGMDAFMDSKIVGPYEYLETEATWEGLHTVCVQWI